MKLFALRRRRFIKSWLFDNEKFVFYEVGNGILNTCGYSEEEFINEMITNRRMSTASSNLIKRYLGRTYRNRPLTTYRNVTPDNIALHALIYMEKVRIADLNTSFVIYGEVKVDGIVIACVKLKTIFQNSTLSDCVEIAVHEKCSLQF